MQALGALLKPMLSHRRRILGENRRRLHFALFQANAVSVLNVDRGNNLHGGVVRLVSLPWEPALSFQTRPFQATKLASNWRPAR